jgi:serine/threonine protein phosphatase PrpC
MNQDCLGSWPDLGLFIVADGMGGHNAGEVASHLAVETIHGFIEESARTADITWPFGLEVNTSIDVNRLTTAVRLANRRIYGEGTKSSELSGMGTTVVAALVAGDRMTMVSVGDSRIYRFRGGTLEQLTSDDAARLGPRRQGSGRRGSGASASPCADQSWARRTTKPESREERLQPGDTFLMHGRRAWQARSGGARYRVVRRRVGGGWRGEAGERSDHARHV